ncbi:hypothetical protein ACN47E_006037 [Coniothyrium glycines]
MLAMIYQIQLASIALLNLSGLSLGQQICSPSTFGNLTLFGGKILQIQAQQHRGLAAEVGPEQNHYAKNITGLEVCEIVVTYTHPGYNDEINTAIWLPPAEQWSGRLLGAGGGGFVAGAESNATLIWAASEGFAVVSTDGGHAAEDAMNMEKWAFLSSGNVNWVQLQDWASTALDDAALLGKSVSHIFYGTPPQKSYFNGCSTGGRQGFQLAQRYPDQYDGILAGAPAIFWNEFVMQMFWPQAVMNGLGEYPSPCELQAIEMASIEACDELDGLKDGIITAPKHCNFNASTGVGKQYMCMSTMQNVTITKAAATVAQRTWDGSISPEGDFLWHGIDKGASFAVAANTTCSNGTCTGAPFIFPELWLKYFLTRDPSFDTLTVNTTNFESYMSQAVDLYDSVIGTSNPNLKQFSRRGGKLLVWHGLADTCIAPDATADYTRRVYERDPNAGDYYRYFEAPGVDHCGGGLGWFPGSALNNLIAWVENGTAPDSLDAETQDSSGAMDGMDGMPSQPSTFVKRTAKLCLWPKSLVYVSGDPDRAESFVCR